MANKKGEKCPVDKIHGPDGTIDVTPGNSRSGTRSEYIGPDGTRFGNEIGPSRGGYDTGFSAWDVGDYDEFH